MRSGSILLCFLALSALTLWWWSAGGGAVEAPVDAPLEAADVGAEPRVVASDAQPDADGAVATSRRDVTGDPRERGTRARGALLVHVVDADGARSLPRVGVRAVARDGRTDAATATVVLTDEQGRARFDALDAGPWELRTDREVRYSNTAPTRIEIVADVEVEVTIHAAVGVDALVRVLDATGARVVGAEVLYWPAGGTLDTPGDDEAQVVGRSGPDGELSLWALPYFGFKSHSSWVAARHPTLGASIARMIPAANDADDHKVRTVELTLGLAGARIEFRVVDANERPIVGAHAVARPVDEPSSKDAPPGRVLEHLRRDARTDAAGIAVVEPLPASEYRLMVDAPGHVPYRAGLRVTGLERITREVRLADAVRVRGLVTSRDGTPIEGADIVVQQEPAGGRAISARDGAFEIGELAVGSAAYVVRHDEHHPLDGTIELSAEHDNELPVRMDPLARLRIRLVDELGVGVSGLEVTATAELPGYANHRRDGTSDAAGLVELGVREGLDYAVVVRPLESGLVMTDGAVGTFRSRDEPYVVRAPEIVRANAYVEGRLVDVVRVDGVDVERPAVDGCYLSIAGMGRILHPGSTMAAAEIDAATGAFRLGPLPPGEFELHVTDAGRFEFSVPGVVLRSDTTTDLGVVRKPASGIVAVELELDPDVTPTDLKVQLDSEAGSAFMPFGDDPRHASQRLLPGTYDLTVYGTGFRWLSGRLTVVAGETVTFRGALHAAVRFGLRFHMPEGEDGATFEVRDARGELAIDTELEKGLSSEDWWPFLDRGAYFVTATGASGRRYQARFEVDALERRTTPFELRVVPVR